MAEYKAIHGTLFQHKTSDPLATGLPGATWSSGGTMNTPIVVYVSIMPVVIFLKFE